MTQGQGEPSTQRMEGSVCLENSEVSGRQASQDLTGRDGELGLHRESCWRVRQRPRVTPHTLCPVSCGLVDVQDEAVLPSPTPCPQQPAVGRTLGEVRCGTLNL